MVLAFWSPKGGSGTSVLAAATALALGRRTPTRLADLAGDQPAVLGIAGEPDHGLDDWLAVGAKAPVEALDRLAVEAAPGVHLLAAGRSRGAAPAEAGAALGVALRDGPPTVVDAGTASTPAAHALVEVADISVLVLRRCYLALRRATRISLTRHATGAVLVEEAGRALSTQEISDVLDLRILAEVPWKAVIANAVDAGVLVGRTPDALDRPVETLLTEVGLARRDAA